MLFRPVLLRSSPRYRRLIRDGAKATAVVIKERPWGWVTGVVRPNHKLTLRVHFDDGSTTTIERVESTANLGALSAVGSKLPVRYEPADHSYIEIDVPDLRRRSAARRAARDRDRLKDDRRIDDRP